MVVAKVTGGGGGGGALVGILATLKTGLLSFTLVNGFSDILGILKNVLGFGLGVVFLIFAI